MEALALNAGISIGGAFANDTPLETELRLIDLNVRSTVHLTKHVVADMVTTGRGRVLFTSSIASTMPGAFQAVYNASKSFVQSFALALRNELKDTGGIGPLSPPPRRVPYRARGIHSARPVPRPRTPPCAPQPSLRASPPFNQIRDVLASDPAQDPRGGGQAGARRT